MNWCWLYFDHRSFRQKIRDSSETKKYTIFLTFVLLINTVIIIVIAINKTSNKVNELSIKNEDNLYKHELSDLSYEQLPSDYLTDLIELDDLIAKTSNVNNQQNNYILSESVDKAVVVPDENNQAQDDD